MGQRLALGALLVALGVGFTGTMRAGENLDFAYNGQIRDMFWDSRLFDGTPNFPGAILWFHNPAGRPSGLDPAAFETRIEASFNAWEAVDDGIPGAPLVPVVNLGGQTGLTDPFALDGVNVIAWEAEGPGGVLAATPCWVLTEPTTTVEVDGHTMMPVDGGPPIPFPGPAGVTYPVGAVVDCGMRWDSLDPWSTSDSPSPSAYDVQAIATHEAGHFIGLSHSTLGDFTGANTISSATMLPLAAAGDANFRTLEEDDKASVLRTYARNRHNGPIAQTVGGRGTIHLTLLKGAACQPATGVSVVAYPTVSGINGPNRVETFSGSHLRAGLLDEPVNGSATLNVVPLPAGQSYRIYARTFEQGLGALSSQRYNYTTINTNLLDPQNQSRTFDGLATVASIAAGQSIDLGNIGILGCWVPDPTSSINIVADFITAPATAVRGTQIAVTSGFRNQGTVASGPFTVGVYFSVDQAITTDDVFTGFACAVSGLSPGATGSCNGSVNVPSAILGNYYVGLLVDRQNQLIESVESDNDVAAANPTTVEPNPLEPIVNGSFETGDLTGWVVKELTPASNPNLPVSVRGAGIEYPASVFIAWPYILDYFTSQPTDGQWAVLHDFNGNDPATNGPTQFINRRELYQDIALPPGTTTLEFDYRAAWELFRFGSTQDRTFDVEIEPAGGGPTLLDRTILVAPNFTIEEDTDNPSGGVGDYPPGSVDLSAFAGQNVRLKFVWNIPEPGTGFGFFQLDNIRLNWTSVPNQPPTVDITSPADGSSFTSGQSITFVATAVDAEDGNIGAGVSWLSSRDGIIGSGASMSTSSLTVGAHTITASVTDSGGLLRSDSIAVSVTPPPNSAPVVTIVTPADGSSFTQGSSISFTGTATDAEDGNIGASLSWSSHLDGDIGSGASVSTSALRVGAHAITASVTDSGGSLRSDLIVVSVTSVGPNSAPVVTIATPANGSSFTQGSAISFTGTADDAEQGNISASLSWSSNRDGAFGSGASVSTSTLSGGSHVIIASVVDAGGLGGSAVISVNVNIDNLAAQDFSTARGTIGGGTSFEDTWADDDVYEVLTEAEQGGGQPARRRSLLEHTWRFNVASGTSYVFKVNAYHGGTEDDFTFAYSRDNVTYTPMVTVTATTDNDQEQVYLIPQDVSGTVYVRVQDTDSTPGNRQLDSLFVDFLVITTVMGGGNVAPVVTVTAPSNGSVFTQGATVSFAGTAGDAEDGDLGGSLAWTSSIDGPIGTGAGFSTSALAVGQHTITSTVTDSGGLPGFASITITVVPDEGVSLSVAGYKVRGFQHADLTWSGATTNVTITRNGVVIATVPNVPGAYTDNIGTKGAGTYSYQVCEVNGGACSNVVMVTF